MKRNQVVTGIAVLAFVGLLVFINRHEPARVSEQRAKEEAEARRLLEEAEGKPKSFKEEMQARADGIFADAAKHRAQQAAATGTPVAAASPFQVEFQCSNGTFVAEIHPEWAPLGAEQFRKIIEAGIYKEARFFRALPGFVVQWGIPGDPELAAEWKKRVILDDPPTQSNVRGTLTYATGGPNTRTTQVFISLSDKNTRLDSMGFAPFGKIVKGMEVVDAIFNGYAEDSNLQDDIELKGNAYLKEYFPKLDYIKEAKILGDVAAPASTLEAAAPAVAEPISQN